MQYLLFIPVLLAFSLQNLFHSFLILCQLFFDLLHFCLQQLVHIVKQLEDQMLIIIYTFLILRNQLIISLTNSYIFPHSFRTLFRTFINIKRTAILMYNCVYLTVIAFEILFTYRTYQSKEETIKGTLSYQ